MTAKKEWYEIIIEKQEEQLERQDKIIEHYKCMLEQSELFKTLKLRKEALTK